MLSFVTYLAEGTVGSGRAMEEGQRVFTSRRMARTPGAPTADAPAYSSKYGPIHPTQSSIRYTPHEYVSEAKLAVLKLSHKIPTNKKVRR